MNLCCVIYSKSAKQVSGMRGGDYVQHEESRDLGVFMVQFGAIFSTFHTKPLISV